MHPTVVQERLGHADISITLDTYSHVTGTLHDDAAERVAALFTDAREQSVSNRAPGMVENEEKALWSQGLSSVRGGT